MKNKIIKSCYYLIPILMLISSIPTVFSSSVWVDEVYSLELAKKSLFDVIKIDAMDVHPPLYYILLNISYMLFWDVLGNNYIWIGKFVSIIPYIVLMILGFTVIKKRDGEITAFLFNIFIIGMPQMLNYSTEIRMYSWGMLFVTCSFIQMIPILHNEPQLMKNYVGLTVFSVLAAYTHYFACVSAIVIYAELILIMLIRKNFKEIKNILISGIGVVVLYLPWLFIFLGQASAVSENYWIPPVTFRTIKDNLLFMFSTGDTISKVVVILIFLLGSVCAVIHFAKNDCPEAACGIGIWGGTIVIGIVLSIVIRPIFVSRYMMGAAACLWFGIAIGLSKIQQEKIKYIVILCSVVVCILGCRKYIVDENNNKMSLEYILKELNNYVDDETVILSNYNHIQRVIMYFYPLNESIMTEDQPVSDLVKLIYTDYNLKQIESIDELSNYDTTNVLVIDRDGSLNKVLTEKGYKLEHIEPFRYLWYSFDTYMIVQ